MRYDELVKINETFQYSINIQFDINNINKVKEYIPTTDSCQVLECYVNSINGKFSKSTTLVGPYGKGKSHLLLVLLTLLNDYEAADEKIINTLINKINKINPNLANDITTIRNEKKKYMPVIINSNYSNLNQAFLLGISEALEREKISDLIIDTYFDIAYKVIAKWENEGYDDVIEKFSICLNDTGVSLKELKSKLKKYDEESYEIFKRVYTCVMHGMEFNPLVNTDIIKYYKDVNYRICQKGYNGMIIVFDEFSKFLEYVGNESIMKDLKLLQDFAELATRTGKREQILLSCITHKTINEYIKNLREDKVNAFKTVEGRFKEIYFNRSIEQNYEIIAETIIKTENFEKFFEKYKKKNSWIYSNIATNYNFLQTDEYEEKLLKGCFPLNPLTVYCLIELCEKIAQNERTLFTFLTDDDKFSLKTYINTSEVGQLVGIEKIYDYFYALLKKEKDDFIKGIWIKAEGVLSKISNEIDKKIIKAVAIIYMLNNYDLIAPTKIVIQDSIGESDITARIDSLVEKGILKIKKSTNYLEFTTVHNKEVLKEIENTVNRKFSVINERSVLDRAFDMGYVLPRRYNQIYKMTRFFKQQFITEEELVNVNNYDVFFKNTRKDGIVFYMLRISNNINKIIEKIKNITDERIIIRLPNNTISEEFFCDLKEYEAIQYLKKENNDEEIQKELELVEQELIDIIQNEIEKIYNISDEYYYKGQKVYDFANIGSLVSKICEEVYYETPIVNNEMINKDDISVPIYKARNIVIDSVLENNKELIQSETSAEATIYKSIVEKKDEKSLVKVINMVKTLIKKSDGKKISLAKIYDKLLQRPYGMRKGIIPIIMSLAIVDYADDLVFYYQSKEIEINSSNIIKTLENSDKYYLTIQKGTKEKYEYIKSLMNLFKVEATECNRINIRNLIISMKKWVLSLPRVVRDLAITNEIVKKETYILIKNELLKSDLNNNEFLFEYLLDILKTEDFKKIIEELSIMKEQFDNYIEKYTNIMIVDFKELYEHNSKSNLGIVLKNWYKNIDSKVKNAVIPFNAKQLLEYAKNIDTHNETEIFQNVSYKMLGVYVEDWQENTQNEFFNGISSVFKEIDDISKISFTNQEKIVISDGNNKIEKYISCPTVSSLGSTLKNNIEDSIEEYGDSISESEKIKVLLQIIKKYM